MVKTGRVMLGETNPADSKPGTIRGDFCIQVGRWDLVFFFYSIPKSELPQKFRRLTLEIDMITHAGQF